MKMKKEDSITWRSNLFKAERPKNYFPYSEPKRAHFEVHFLKCSVGSINKIQISLISHKLWNFIGILFKFKFPSLNSDQYFTVIINFESKSTRKERRRRRALEGKKNKSRKEIEEENKFSNDMICDVFGKVETAVEQQQQKKKLKFKAQNLLSRIEKNFYGQNILL